MNVISTVIVIGIAVFALVYVVSSGNNLIEKALSVYEQHQMEKIFHYIDNAIEETSLPNSARSLSFRNIKTIKIYNSTNTLEAVFPNTQQAFRTISGNFMKIAGADVNCYNYTMENTYVTFVFRNISGFVNSSDVVASALEKRTGVQINFTDSSVFVDNYSSGNGYVKMMRTGNNLPYCRLKVFINNTLSYNIYYTLYAFADFLTIDVKINRQ